MFNKNIMDKKVNRNIEWAREALEKANAPDSWENLDNHDLSAAAFSIYTQYGRTRDPALHDEVRRMHSILVRRLPEGDRLLLAQDIARYIEETADSGELALVPFILGESSLQIISSTVIDYAMLMHGNGAEDMPGPRFLLDQYRQVPVGTRLGILAGLILLGDCRLFLFICGRWRDFDKPEHRRYLAGVTSGFVSTLQIDFLLEWIQCTDDEEDIAVIAGSFARMPQASINGVVTRIVRCFPASRAGEENPVRVLEEWSFADYARDHLGPRLKPDIERESEPKVLQKVLDAWMSV